MTIPEHIRFGTSSWAYPGWQGLVYHQRYPKNRFSRDCLGEYARYEYRGVPLFRTVGVDHTFYRPATQVQFAHYATQLPPGFLVCSKVWEDLTIPAYARHARYGEKAGMENPRFLDATAFVDLVLEPTRQGLGAFLGPFIFEFQRSGLPTSQFLDRLDRFLAMLPAGVPYAIEVRNPAILGERYRDVLRAHGVGHVYNHWTAMPPLARQHEMIGRRFTTDFAVIRLLTPLGMAYEKAVSRAAPYDRLVQPLLDMRADTVTLLHQAASEQCRLFVLANNRAEGNAPMTIQAILDAWIPAPPATAAPSRKDLDGAG